MKKGQYSPMSVEKQIAIIFCGTRNLLRNVPLKHIRDFEMAFLNHIELAHSNVLKNLKEGKFLDEDVKVLEQAAKEFAAKFE